MLIKDPLYGYIELSDKIAEIIDTPCFQRLRDIIQTSYAPLFPTSVHNRFSHSLGVYFLGRKAIEALFNNLNLELKREINSKKEGELNEKTIKEIFNLACLLHDVGHAPFSHTGENFYLDQQCDPQDALSSEPKLLKDLQDLLDDAEYVRDLSDQKYCNPKAHEYMSAYLGVKKFLNDRKKQEKVLFVRCIIGLQYYNCDSIYKQVLNGCIELLNSTTIDVDKLDYLIRDSYMTGFNSMNIDYVRLLSGITLNCLPKDKEHNILTDESGYDYRHVFIGFKKQSLSVIENVILANDLERKWIQSHPVVLYNSFLMQIIMHNIINRIGDATLFSYNSLIEEGNVENQKTQLLSDSDITYLMKNVYYDEWSKEYFNRNEWRHPLWKSQAEFKYLNNQLSPDSIDKLNRVVENIEHDLLYNIYNVRCINQKLLDAYESDMKKIQRMLDEEPNQSSKRTVEIKKENLEPKIKFLKFLKGYCKKQNPKCKFDFIVRSNGSFNSGFNKIDFKNIEIYFDRLKGHCTLKKLLPILESEVFGKKYFYIYMKDPIDRIDVKDFCSEMDAMVIKNFSN